jgi:hypothetical protein
VELLRTIARVPEHYRISRAGLACEKPSGRAYLKAIDQIEQLFEYSADLEELATDLAVQNVAYEPWVMHSILKACSSDHKFLFLLIFDNDAMRGSRLIGFFPFERITLHSLLPLSCLRLWADPFNYLNARCDPLVRKGHEHCIDALLDWFLQGNGNCNLLNLRGLTDGTSITRTLMSRLSDDGALAFAHSTIESHLYRRQISAGAYINAILSTKSQQTLRRYERRLRDLGEVEYADVAEASDIGALIDEFIALEHQGWKGKQGVSIAAYGHREWVRDLLADAHERKRLSLLTMRVGGKLIAARCVFLAKPGSFLFKLTYDEDDLYAKRSPGLLLELEAIRRMHSDSELLGRDIEWLDTCSSPFSLIFSRSRSEALKIHRFVVARNRTPAALGISMFPHVRRIGALLSKGRSWTQSKIKALRC